MTAKHRTEGRPLKECADYIDGRVAAEGHKVVLLHYLHGRFMVAQFFKDDVHADAMVPPGQHRRAG
jgi:hypothetical protein